MTIQDQTWARRLAWIRCIYLTVYVVVYALAYSIQISARTYQVLFAVYYLIAAFGGVLLVVDLLYRRTMFRPKYCGLLILFVVALLISMFTNIQYGVLGNVQAIVWFLIQFFLMAAVNDEVLVKLQEKQMRIVMDAFGLVWLVMVLWSLGMYAVQYHDIVYDGHSQLTLRVGFVEGRLHGVFKDPNFASICSVAAVAFAVVSWILGPKRAARRVFTWVQIGAQSCYIILAASRTVTIALVVAIVFLATVLGLRFAEKKTKKKLARLGIILLAVVLLVLASILYYNLLKTALAYLPGTLEGNFCRLSMERPDVGEGKDISNNRLSIYMSYLELAQNKPLFGLSPRNAVAYARDVAPDCYIAQSGYTAHSGYLGLFVYTGLVGSVIMLSWMVLVVCEVTGYLFRRRSLGDQHYDLILILSSFLIVCAVSAVPLLTIFYSSLIYDTVFWVTLGYVRALVRMSEPERYTKMPLPYRLTERVFAHLKKKEKA